MNISKPDIITILGPTAVGKTRLAALLADKLDSAVFSADSRQVYRQMNLGTGKDYADYEVNGKTVPNYLLDIADPGTEFNIFAFSRQFYSDFNRFHNTNRIPVFCGGSGMYLETILCNRHLPEVPVNETLRKSLAEKNDSELTAILSGYRQQHNSTDNSDRNRLIRAIEIADFIENHQTESKDPDLKSAVFGISCDRDILKKRITTRLKQRLNEGMIEEVKALLEQGITKDQLLFYGLEYKYLTLFISGELRYNDMLQKLNSAIHQFAKRQMTFFRHLEKNGMQIHWLDSEQTMDNKLNQIAAILRTDYGVEI